MPALTEDQLDARRHGIGSSDVGAILGLSTFQGRNQWGVWNEKKGLAREPSTPAQMRGHDLEPILVRWYEQHTGRETLPGGTIHHPDEPWAFATIDAKLIGIPAGIEAKAVGAAMMRHWDATAEDGVPHEVRVQCAWQMWCAQYDAMHISCMLGGPSNWSVFVVPRDEELEALVVPKCRAFWESIVEDSQPPIDGSDECRRYLEAKYPPRESAPWREATAEEEQWAMARYLAHQRQKENEAAKKVFDNHLRVAVGDGADIVGKEGWRVTVRKKYTFTPARSWKGGDE